MPAKTLKKLPTLAEDFPPRPPDTYPYFGPADERPSFVTQPPGADVHWSNAWWLADFSLLAYCKESDIRVGLRNSGFQMRREGFIEKEKGAQVMIADSSDAIVVAFRGTQVPNIGGGTADFVASMQAVLNDWGTDARAGMTPFDVNAKARGRVHAGFAESFERVRKDIEQVLKQLLVEKPGRSVWYTGHSLGGALATLAAASLGNATGLYTYGCPRVGDADFVATFPAVPQMARFVDPRDPIPLVPTALFLPYADFSPAIEVETPGLFDGLLRNIRRHAPMRYSVLIWNRLVSGQ